MLVAVTYTKGSSSSTIVDRPDWHFTRLGIHPTCPRFLVASLQDVTSAGSTEAYGGSRIVVVDSDDGSLRDVHLGNDHAVEVFHISPDGCHIVVLRRWGASCDIIRIHVRRTHSTPELSPLSYQA